MFVWSDVVATRHNEFTLDWPRVTTRMEGAAPEFSFMMFMCTGILSFFISTHYRKQCYNFAFFFFFFWSRNFHFPSFSHFRFPKLFTFGVSRGGAGRGGELNRPVSLFSLIWSKRRDLILLFRLCPQGFSWKRCKNSASKRPSVSQSGMTWPRFCPDASPWSTAILTTTRSSTRTTGPTEAARVRSGAARWRGRWPPGERVSGMY